MSCSILQCTGYRTMDAVVLRTGTVKLLLCTNFVQPLIFLSSSVDHGERTGSY